MREIIALVKDGDPSKRLAGIEALERLGDSLAADWLAWLLWDENETVRSAAAWALVRLDMGALPALLKVFNSRYRSHEPAMAFGSLGTPAMKLLLLLVRHPNGRIRYAAGRGLAKIGTPVVEPLIEILADGKHFGQDGVAVALGEIGDTRAVEELIIQVEKTKGMTQYYIIRALENLADARAIDALTRVMREGSFPNNSNAQTALKAIGTPEALDAIEKFKNEREAYYRELRAKNARPPMNQPLIRPKKQD